MGSSSSLPSRALAETHSSQRRCTADPLQAHLCTYHNRQLLSKKMLSPWSAFRKTSGPSGCHLMTTYRDPKVLNPERLSYRPQNSCRATSHCTAPEQVKHWPTICRANNTQTIAEAQKAKAFAHNTRVQSGTQMGLGQPVTHTSALKQ